jgi:hypothetical protein
LLDMHRDIRRTLDRLSAADGVARSGAIDELRWRLLLHDDVMRRIVHPIAQRHAGTDADDPIWLAEDEESDAEVRLRRIERVDEIARAPASVVAPLIDEVHRALDRDEATIVRLLRERLDAEQLADLGDAIQEACATSRVNIGR